MIIQLPGNKTFATNYGPNPTGSSTPLHIKFSIIINRFSSYRKLKKEREEKHYFWVFSKKQPNFIT
jgi:hypothetical protein